MEIEISSRMQFCKTLSNLYKIIKNETWHDNYFNEKMKDETSSPELYRALNFLVLRLYFALYQIYYDSSSLAGYYIAKV